MSDDRRIMMSLPRNGATLTLPGFRLLAQRVCIAVCLPACVKQLPPAPTPQTVAPALQPAPPPPGGHGRLVVDVVEGPAPVQRIQLAPMPQTNARGRTTYRFNEVPEVFCAQSPCAVDVPVGNVLLGFPVIGNDALEVELVHVGPDPSVYRRSLSLYEDNTGGVRLFGILATSIASASLITGAVLLPIGLSKDNTGLTTAGGITLGLGTIFVALGIWAIKADAPTFRPGSSNHFPLAPQP